MPLKSLWLHWILLLRKLVRTFPQLVSCKLLASSTRQKWVFVPIAGEGGNEKPNSFFNSRRDRQRLQRTPRD